jgi:hypothetical protein
MRLLAIAILLASSSAAAAPGSAFVQGRGVFRVDDTGKVTTVTPDKDLPMSVAIDKDGDPWVATVVGRLTAHKQQKRTFLLPSKDEHSKYPVAMTAAAAGGMWALGREQLFQITAEMKLKKHAVPVKRILGPAALLEVGDKVWLASDHGLYRFTGKKWEAMHADPHDHLVRDSNGIVWSMRRTKGKPQVLVGHDGTKWLESPIDGDGVAALAAGRDGRVYALVWAKGQRDSRIDVLTTTAGTPKWTARKHGGVDGLRLLAVDEGERIWTRHEHGVLVLGADGKRLVHLPPGTVAGLSGTPSQIAVAGAGPTTLPSAGEVAKGSITGRFMKSAKEPLANASLELCIGDCMDASSRIAITTDADGKFTVDGVPAIEYASFRTTGGTTIHAIGNVTLAGGNPKAAAKRLECCLAVAGKTTDLGTLRAPSP